MIEALELKWEIYSAIIVQRGPHKNEDMLS